MDANLKKDLQKTACRIRMGVIEGTFNAKSGHPGGSLSIAEDLAYLYWKEMKVDPENPQWEDRDRLVLSKGHCAPALYAALAEKGYFPASELKKLRHTGAMLQGHPDMKHIPGVDMTTGSLGQGVSAACGMALAAKISGKDYRTYTILGDGEIEEGQVWEAAMFAAHYKLDNLCAIVDNNGLQIYGPVASVVSPDPLPDPFAPSGWPVIPGDAHDLAQREAAFAEARPVKGKPTAIIQKSVKGKGVSFMENQVGWHGAAPNAEQYETAMAELKAQLDALDAQ